MTLASLSLPQVDIFSLPPLLGGVQECVWETVRVQISVFLCVYGCMSMRVSMGKVRAKCELGKYMQEYVCVKESLRCKCAGQPEWVE